MVKLCCPKDVAEAYLREAQAGEAKGEAGYVQARKQLNLYTTTL